MANRVHVKRVGYLHDGRAVYQHTVYDGSRVIRVYYVIEGDHLSQYDNCPPLED
jgi:hypothetical protein